MPIILYAQMFVWCNKHTHTHTHIHTHPRTFILPHSLSHWSTLPVLGFTINLLSFLVVNWSMLSVVLSSQKSINFNFRQLIYFTQTVNSRSFYYYYYYILFSVCFAVVVVFCCRQWPSLAIIRPYSSINYRTKRWYPLSHTYIHTDRCFDLSQRLISSSLSSLPNGNNCLQVVLGLVNNFFLFRTYIFRSRISICVHFYYTRTRIPFLLTLLPCL